MSVEKGKLRAFHSLITLFPRSHVRHRRPCLPNINFLSKYTPPAFFLFLAQEEIIHYVILLPINFEEEEKPIPMKKQNNPRKRQTKRKTKPLMSEISETRTVSWFNYHRK